MYILELQADKDFVWNLWKRLQADKPDMTSVVSMVVARYVKISIPLFNYLMASKLQIGTEDSYSLSKIIPPVSHWKSF